MTTEKMTVHKALCELKTLDARIQKSIQQGTFVFANKHSNNKVAGVSIGTYSISVGKRPHRSPRRYQACGYAVQRYCQGNDWWQRVHGCRSNRDEEPRYPAEAVASQETGQ